MWHRDRDSKTPTGCHAALTTRAVAFAALALTASATHAGDGRITLLKTPDGGIQPQAAIEASGTIHLISFRGDPYRGDLYYTTLKPDAGTFAASLRVNSQPGTAVAAGTIRGGQLVLGKGGRVHVVWNGPVNAVAKDATHEGAALFYSRSNTGRTAFEPQRDLIQHTSALDGGGTVAADSDGNVHASWHGRAPDAPAGEAGRALWLVRSADDGATFTSEEPTLSRSTGACACCGTRALASPDGVLYVLYRAATRGTERDMMLLASRDRGRHFQGRSLQPWRVSVCPMSSETLAAAPGGEVVAAWETAGQVSFARVNRAAEPVSPAGRPGDRKHPAVALNERGDVLLAWTEGTGWQKGGHLAWQIFDSSGRPTAEKGRVRNGIPVWGLPTAVARPDGSFVIIH
ncbi:MAG: hypothetical protein P4L84_37205 [Isosphaeraceae bacterium]|nr:hypothetical protein [Isosphaeraceae bacterium]